MITASVWHCAKGDIVIKFTGDVYYRWWWKEIAMVGINFGIGVDIYLGPFGHFHWWLT